MIQITNLTKSFDGVPVLKTFNATFADGEFITLLGPSGCGKTTILRMIAGFEIPTTGEICLDGKLVSGGKTFLPPEKRDIGMVFQSYAVWPHMNVFDNVAYPLEIKHVPKDEIKTRVEEMLATVHLSQYADRLPSQLSGGQQQRIALARALVAKPKILLLDEPLSNLDAKLRETMRFEIRDITRERGIGVVYVTHDQTEAARGDLQQSGQSLRGGLSRQGGLLPRDSGGGADHDPLLGRFHSLRDRAQGRRNCRHPSGKHPPFKIQRRDHRYHHPDDLSRRRHRLPCTGRREHCARR